MRRSYSTQEPAPQICDPATAMTHINAIPDNSPPCNSQAAGYMESPGMCASRFP